MKYALPLLLSLCLLGLAHAEQKQSFGPYDVHYSIVNTTFLKPDVARLMASLAATIVLLSISACGKISMTAAM